MFRDVGIVQGLDADLLIGGIGGIAEALVRAAGAVGFRAGGLQFVGAAHIQERLGGGAVGRALNHGAAVGAAGVAFHGVAQADVFRAVLHLILHDGLIGQADQILTGDDLLVHLGGRSGADHAVLDQIGQIAPGLLVAKLIAHERENGVELTEAGGSGGGIGNDDLAGQLGIEQGGVAFDGHAQLLLKLGVHDQAHVLGVLHGVVVVLVHHRLLVIVHGRVLIEAVPVGVAVGLEQAAADHVRLGIGRLVAHAGNQGAQGILDPFDLAIGIYAVPDLFHDGLLTVVHGGVHDDGIAHLFCIARPRGPLRTGRRRKAQHKRQSQNQGNEFLHGFPSPFLIYKALSTLYARSSRTQKPIPLFCFRDTNR